MNEMGSLWDKIQEMCYMPNGKKKSIASRADYWEKAGEIDAYRRIMEITSFLPTVCPFACRAWHIEHQNLSRPLCQLNGCVNEVKWRGRYATYCSKKCSSNSPAGKTSRSENIIRLNSSDDFQDKRRDGVSEYWKSPESNERRSRSSDAMRKRHGDGEIEEYIRKYYRSDDFVSSGHRKRLVERMTERNPITDPSVVRKVLATKKERYGDERYNNINKIMETHRARYANGHVSRNGFADDAMCKMNDQAWMRNELSGRRVSDVAGELGVCDTTLRFAMKKHGVTCGVSRSGIEIEIASFLDDLGVEYNTAVRSIMCPYEIDFVLPSIGIAIECNGTYWHSESRGKGRRYHLDKTKACADVGISLIHVWEHDMRDRKDLVLGRLKAKIGRSQRLYARKGSVGEISKVAADAFLHKNHIQGKCQSSYNLGLSIDNRLVAVMTFSKSRFNKKVDWELLRYCSEIGVNVVGGASKMFKHFVRTLKPVSVISYSDISWNNGDMYGKLGFEKHSDSPPAYHYTRDYRTVENRMKYQKHKLNSLLESFEPSLTEWENMQNNGFDRIWDCGNTVWVWNDESPN